jgi:hypothetical protein
MDYERISGVFVLYGDRGFTELNQAGKKSRYTAQQSVILFIPIFPILPMNG